MLYLAERQLAEGSSHHSCEGCLQRILSTIHNATEIGGVATCRQVQVPTFANLALKVLGHKRENHEYMLKTLINILVAMPESFEALP